MRVLILLHVPFEGPGYFFNYFEAKGFTIQTVHLYEDGFMLPQMEEVDLVLVMGGPMSVHDEEAYPFLVDEKRFLKECLEAGKKVVGVCLGAQLIEDVLGWKVQKAKVKEIGWFGVRPTGALEAYPEIANIFKEPLEVFHWHGEEVIGEDSLLDSQANGNQLFTPNRNTLAIQFHLEATPESVNAMLEACGEGLSQASSEDFWIQTPEEMSRDVESRCQKSNAALTKLMDWLLRQ
jgi:GMP synthase-like glutamine amidotransferase